MLIRSATLVDLNACLAMNADSQTDHVWQMEQRKDNHNIAIRFQPVRLPRVMYVTYPRQRDDLLSCWENGATVLVATDQPVVEQPDNLADREEPKSAPKIDFQSLPDFGSLAQTTFTLGGEPRIVASAPLFGYCQLDSSPWQQAGWITHLIVNRPFRRRSIGTALLKASIAWGRTKGLPRLMVAVQTKNYPAISFCEKHRFTFCGFNDHYFVNRDIALFFTLKI